MKKYTIIGMWNNYNYDNNFITNYLKNIHIYVDKNNKNIDFLISGPFLNKEDYDYILNKECLKILYITEPIEINTPYKLCYELLQKNSFNRIIGCTNQGFNKIKFPLYINFVLDHETHFFNKINEYVLNNNLKDKKFCSLINTHDNWNTRTPIYNKIKDLGKIDCPSLLYNNLTIIEIG